MTYQSRFLFRGVMLAVLLGTAWLFWKDNRGHIRERLKELLKQPWLVLFLIYAGYLLVSTIFARPLTTPFRRIFKYLIPGSRTANREIVENYLLFIPFGFLFCPVFKPDKPFRTVLAAAAGTSAAIEVTQLLLWLGEFQLCDLIYNTAGGLTGWLVWALIQLMTKGKRKKP